MSAFIPRKVFPRLDSLSQSYYLGHHAAGLQRMKSLLSQIDLIIECRDYRIPITSRNPLFEQHLGDRPRLIVYTHQDLGGSDNSTIKRQEAIIRKWDAPSLSFFIDVKDPSNVRKVLQSSKEHAITHTRLVGSRMMVIGMPNVGKSSLLNALRNASLGLKKAALTGDQPGVTRKISTEVKIVEKDDNFGGVYLKDTPGVFVPYIPDSESMLKLALCGNVAEDLADPVTKADYLLYHLNLNDPTVYEKFSEPTNQITSLLTQIAAKTGKLKKGGIPNLNSASKILIQRWRDGKMGKFVLDEVTEDSLEKRKFELEHLGGSMNQAKKEARETKRQETLRKTSRSRV